MFDIDLTPVFEYAATHKPKFIGVQIPEGLKPRAQAICDEIERKTHAQTLLFIDPIFGACMLADEKAKAYGCDLLVHLGHNRFYRESMPTIYIPVRYHFEDAQIARVVDAIANIAQQNAYKTVGLVAVIQTTHLLPRIAETLKTRRVETVIGKQNGFMAEGQILGCNYSTAKLISDQVDAVMYVGDGQFHPIGLVIDTEKPVHTIDPFTGTTAFLSNARESFYKKRMGLLAKSLDAKTYGILVSSEKGQWGVTKARHTKKQIEDAGRTAIILAGDLLKPDYLAGIAVDCLVNTACPRIATDDSNNYGVPVLSLYELDFALGKKPLDQFELEKTI
jgi:2-(3-amino-3-carboxypropyl)histidine synthase